MKKPRRQQGRGFRHPAFSNGTHLLAMTFPMMMHVDLVADRLMMMRVSQSRSDGKKCHASGKYGDNSLFHQIIFLVMEEAKS
ncbi:hypothetical protein [Caballeronia hypogeia]|uniref:hypothetical protein n=1 Tax=Caballeronia hypogeia TaxID=1777140 RepID=UPI0012FDBFAD|nr:hypothetical protein [Caballeronia hypogeia]